MSDKVCKCKFEGSWNDIEIVEMPIEKLWPSVPIAIAFGGKKFYEPVKNDIEKNGLNFPLLVVEATYAQVCEEKKKHKKHMNKPPSDCKDTDMMYVIWGGSNRVKIVEELGYTHVDCVLYKKGDFARAWKDQSLHRDPYKKKFY